MLKIVDGLPIYLHNNEVLVTDVGCPKCGDHLISRTGTRLKINYCVSWSCSYYDCGYLKKEEGEG